MDIQGTLPISQSDLMFPEAFKMPKQYPKDAFRQSRRHAIA